MNFLKLSNVRKEINGHIVLDNINLSLETGKIYGFVGRNGCGKTMLFKAIAGLINISSGKIIINEKELKNGDICEELGIIIENPGFLVDLSGIENLQLLASVRNKISIKEIRQAISLVGLNPDDKRAVKKYSLGMKQRLGIAQAIMENPRILLLDEPMNGLDEEAVLEFRKKFLKLKEDKLILITSHNKEDILELCDVVYKMNNGKIL